MKALILAGGRGSRLNEFTKDKNKSMIEILSKPIISYNLDHAFDLNVNEIIIVVGYKSEDIINYVGNKFKSIPVKYVFQKKQRGLIHAIECAKETIGSSDFFLMLADEIVINPDIKGMLKFYRKNEAFAVCGTILEEDKLSIGKTYSAMINKTDSRVFRLIEKPRFPINKIKGTGHCIIRNEMFSYIERTPINANRGERELVDWLQCAIDEGKKVYTYDVAKAYVNINTKDDYDLAKQELINSNPRVLIVHPQMNFFGGAELLITELCNWLTKKGIKNSILTANVSDEVRRQLINTPVIVPKNKIIISSKGFDSIKSVLNFIFIFRKVLKNIKQNYDVINFHNYPATWTLWPRNKPAVWMLNEPPNLWSNPNANRFLKLLNKLRYYSDKFIVRNSINSICVADDFNKKRCIERYGINPKIVFYGVNHDFFSNGHKEKAIKKWKLKNKFVVIQSGVISAQKNQIESLIAINNIKSKIPNLLLILAGKVADEDYMHKLQNFIKENNLEKNVLITGNLNRNELRDLYKVVDVGLFPVGEQGGWLSPFELLCASKPIIVSTKMGVASVVKEYNLGILSSNYSETLLLVYKNYNSFKSDAEKAALFIKRNFGWDVFTDKLIDEYKVVLNRK